MIVAIADTHTAIWYLFSDPRLGSGASAFIDATMASGDHIGISAISLAEMVYLIEKERIPAGALDDVLRAIGDPRSVLQHVSLDDAVAVSMRQVPRQDVPDLPDRIIAATACFMVSLFWAVMDAFAPPASKRFGEEPTAVPLFAIATERLPCCVATIAR